MQTLSVLRLVEACARGARVTVIIAGKPHELPLEPEAVTPPPPSAIEVLSQQLLARDAQMRTAVESVTEVAAQADARNAELQGLVRTSIDGQQRIVDTLMLPVVPTKYDKAGRLVEARRKETE